MTDTRRDFCVLDDNEENLDNCDEQFLIVPEDENETNIPKNRRLTFNIPSGRNSRGQPTTKRVCFDIVEIYDWIQTNPNARLPYSVQCLITPEQKVKIRQRVERDFPEAVRAEEREFEYSEYDPLQNLTEQKQIFLQQLDDVNLRIARNDEDQPSYNRERQQILSNLREIELNLRALNNPNNNRNNSIIRNRASARTMNLGSPSNATERILNTLESSSNELINSFLPNFYRNWKTPFSGVEELVADDLYTIERIGIQQVRFFAKCYEVLCSNVNSQPTTQQVRDLLANLKDAIRKFKSMSKDFQQWEQKIEQFYNEKITRSGTDFQNAWNSNTINYDSIELVKFLTNLTGPVPDFANDLLEISDTANDLHKFIKKFYLTNYTSTHYSSIKNLFCGICSAFVLDEEGVTAYEEEDTMGYEFKPQVYKGIRLLLRRLLNADNEKDIGLSMVLVIELEGCSE